MTGPSQLPKGQRSGARKFVWLGGAVVLACVLWTVGWFYAADRMRTHLPALLQLAARSGIVSDCTNADVRGYPFRIGLFCDRTRLEIPAQQVTASAAGFRSAAQIYRPGHVVSELDGPLTIAGPGALAARLDWQNLRTSSVVGLAGLNRAALEGRLLSVDMDSPKLPAKLSMTADSVGVHIRQNGGDADLAGSANQVNARFGPQLEAQSLTYDLTLVGGADWLSGQRESPATLRGSSIVIRDATLAFSDLSRVGVSGKVDVGADGLVSGTLKLKIAGIEEVIAVLSAVAPKLAEQAGSLAPVLSALDTEPGDDSITLPLNLRDGRASMGFLPLGRIPPL